MNLIFNLNFEHFSGGVYNVIFIPLKTNQALIK